MWYDKIRSYWETINHPLETGIIIVRGCDHPGCAERGDFKAPKSRDELKDYYWFCLEHVRAYNQSWDFFRGMSQAEIEQSLSRTSVWDRPTWQASQAGFNEGKIRRKVYSDVRGGKKVHQGFGTSEEDEGADNFRVNAQFIPHPAIEALATIGLAPPVDWEDVKARYKELVKKYHPDINIGDAQAEERLKKINLAYSILKLSHQHFIKLKKDES